MPFVPVARVEDIAVGHATYAEHDGIAVAVFNAGGGRFHAHGATCPHEDGPLAEGWLES
jgi:nitrite reductase/ring-hydroxylating ferredoxin subunit